MHQLVIAESREFLPFFLYIRAVGLAGIVNWLSATDSNTSSTTAVPYYNNISRFPAEAISKTPIFVFLNKTAVLLKLKNTYKTLNPDMR